MAAAATCWRSWPCPARRCRRAAFPWLREFARGVLRATGGRSHVCSLPAAARSRDACCWNGRNGCVFRRESTSHRRRLVDRDAATPLRRPSSHSGRRRPGARRHARRAGGTGRSSAPRLGQRCPSRVKQAPSRDGVSRETRGSVSTPMPRCCSAGTPASISWPRETPRTFGRRHVEDAAQLLPLLPRDTCPAADLGSGGGLPGMVLAMAEPDRPWHLVEADKRKAAFLRTAAAELGAGNVSVHAVRIEDAVLPALGLAHRPRPRPARLSCSATPPDCSPRTAWPCFPKAETRKPN